MTEKQTRTDTEIGDEALVMTYLDILKYAKHHCSNGEDPYEITDHIFIDNLKAVSFGDSNSNA